MLLVLSHLWFLALTSEMWVYNMKQTQKPGNYKETKRGGAQNGNTKIQMIQSRKRNNGRGLQLRKTRGGQYIREIKDKRQITA